MKSHRDVAVLRLVLASAVVWGPGSAALAQGTVTSPALAPRSRAPIDSADLAAFIDPLVRSQMTKEHIPGAVLLVVQSGRVLYQRGYGFANEAAKIPVDPEKTIWRIGSISKVFTATAVVQLADRGHFRLTDDVNRYLTRFKVPATFPDPVRFEHLLTHTAGFDEIRPGTRADAAGDVLRLSDFLATKLVRLRPPGQTISYSTYGITLAGHLVEQLSGLDFETYMRRNVWLPLGMTRTNINVPDSLRADVAQGYEYDNGANQLAQWEWYHTTPASSINATAADMGRFIIAQLQNGRLGNTRILSDAAARDMHTTHVRSDPRLAGFAYGFYEDLSGGVRLIEHGGNVEGFSAQLTLIPDRGVGFFIASQHEPAALRDVVQKALLDRYFPADKTVMRAVPMAGFRERAKRFAGSYELNEFCHTCGADRRVYPKIEVRPYPDGTVSITGIEEHFVETSPFFFQRLSGAGRPVVFRQDATGRITLLAGDHWLVFERVK